MEKSQTRTNASPGSGPAASGFGGHAPSGAPELWQSLRSKEGGALLWSDLKSSPKERSEQTDDVYDYLLGVYEALLEIGEGRIERRDEYTSLLRQIRFDLTTIRLEDNKAFLDDWAADGPARAYDTEVGRVRKNKWRAVVALSCHGKRLTFIRFAGSKVEAYELALGRAAAASLKWAEKLDRRAATGSPPSKGSPSPPPPYRTVYVPRHVLYTGRQPADDATRSDLEALHDAHLEAPTRDGSANMARQLLGTLGSAMEMLGALDVAPEDGSDEEDEEDTGGSGSDGELEVGPGVPHPAPEPSGPPGPKVINGLD